MKSITFISLFVCMIIMCGCSVHREMIEIPIEQPDLARVPDGTYSGSYENYRWYCDVEVEVRDHRMDTIEVLSSANGTIGFYSKLVSRVIEQQSIEVDAVSGATITSSTFLKAVENALD